MPSKEFSVRSSSSSSSSPPRASDAAQMSADILEVTSDARDERQTTTEKPKRHSSRLTRASSLRTKQQRHHGAASGHRDSSSSDIVVKKMMMQGVTRSVSVDQTSPMKRMTSVSRLSAAGTANAIITGGRAASVDSHATWKRLSQHVEMEHHGGSFKSIDQAGRISAVSSAGSKKSIAVSPSAAAPSSYTSTLQKEGKKSEHIQTRSAQQHYDDDSDDDITNIFDDPTQRPPILDALVVPGAYHMDSVEQPPLTVLRDSSDQQQQQQQQWQQQYYSDDDDDDIATTAAVQDNTAEEHGMVSVANAVRADDLEAQVRKDILSTVIPATQVESTGAESEAAKQRMKRMGLMIVCCCSLVISGIVVGTISFLSNDPSVSSLNGTEERAPLTPEEKSELEGWLQSNVPFDSSAILDDSTSSYRAIEWMALVGAKLPQISITPTTVQNDDDLTSRDPFYNESRLLQYYGLTTFFYQVSGRSWTSNTNWLSTKDDETLDYCNWFGVTCDDDRNVLKLELDDNELVGFDLPMEIGLLIHTTTLSLNNNRLNLVFGGSSGGGGGPDMPTYAGDGDDGGSEIPIDVDGGGGFNLPDDGTRRLQKPTPPGEHNLPQGLPSSIGLMQSLEIFRISNAGLGGTIPPEFGSIPSLQEIDLGRTYLVRSIPSELGNLQHLSILDLESNFLTGQLPSELGNLQKLDKFLVADNKLEGGIPQTYLSWSTSITMSFYANEGLSSDALQSTFCSSGDFLNSKALVLEADCGMTECTCCTRCCTYIGMCVSNGS